jgi:hypothetical protein
LQLNRLHGVISQKILFITTAVETSDPTGDVHVLKTHFISNDHQR